MLVGAIGALCGACGREAPQPLPATKVAFSEPKVTSAVEDPEAYAVYGAILKMGRRAAGAARYVVRRETGTRHGCEMAGDPEDPAWRPVMASFTEANAESHALLDGQPLGSPYVVVSSKTIFESFGGGQYGWEGFHARFQGAGGYHGMSAVGFDPGRTRALVYMDFACGGLCGYGRTHFLRKVDGQWQWTEVRGVKPCQWAS